MRSLRVASAASCSRPPSPTSKTPPCKRSRLLVNICLCRPHMCTLSLCCLALVHVDSYKYKKQLEDSAREHKRESAEQAKKFMKLLSSQKEKEEALAAKEAELKS